jgi:hypothetical protein
MDWGRILLVFFIIYIVVAVLTFMLAIKLNKGWREALKCAFAWPLLILCC